VGEGPEPMTSRYDAETDALDVQLAEARIVGSEILDASQHVAEGADLAHLVAA